jgi:hypothetical protein
MWQRAFYHEGMSELQDRFDGRRVAEAIERHRKHYEFWDDEKQLIETSPFFFIGTSHADYVDCNIKSGDPGFVKIVGPNILEYPEYDGNSMYRTLGNLSRNPNVGLLFVRFDGKSRRMRINAARRYSMTLRRSAGITARSWSYASNVKSIRTARVMCPISRAPSCRLMFRAKARGRRPRRSGRAATISGISCPKAIRTPPSSRPLRGRGDPAWPLPLIDQRFRHICRCRIGPLTSRLPSSGSHVTSRVLSVASPTDATIGTNVP